MSESVEKYIRFIFFQWHYDISYFVWAIVQSLLTDGTGDHLQIVPYNYKLSNNLIEEEESFPRELRNQPLYCAAEINLYWLSDCCEPAQLWLRAGTSLKIRRILPKEKTYRAVIHRPPQQQTCFQTLQRSESEPHL